jgi:polar amino acid transport system substrate-binding protein
MKKLTALLVCALMALTLTACNSGHDSGSGTVFSAYTDFSGEKIGVPSGNLAESIIRDDIGGIPVLYPDITAALADIRSGEIAGFITDLSIVRVLADSHSDLRVIPVPAEIFAGALGAFSTEQGIIDDFNAFLDELEKDGTLAEMREKWLETVPNADTPMPDITLTGENGTIRIATSGDGIPFSYMGANAELKGYSVELALRFAESVGMDVEFITMPFADLISAVQNGNADLGIDAVTITDERAEFVIFTNSIYDDTLGILALKQ